MSASLHNRRVLSAAMLLCHTLVYAYGCTERKPESTGNPPIAPRREPVESPTGGNNPAGGDVTGDTSVTISLSAEDIKAIIGTDTAKVDKVSYQVNYQGVVIGPEVLGIKDGKATITVNGLIPDEAADLELTLLLESKPKLKAVVSGLKLQADTDNPVTVTLKPVDTSAPGGSATGGSATGGSTTGGSTTGGSTTGGSTTGGSTTGGSTTGGSTTGGSATGGSATGGSATGGSATGGSVTGASGTTGTSTGGLAAPALWDGKSDKGTTKWKIVPVP